MSISKRPLSILLVIDSLGSGGAQRQLVCLATGFASRGHNVALFTYYPELSHFKSDLEEHDIEIFEVKKRFRLDLRPFLELRRLLKSRNFDSIVSFLDTPNIYTILAAMGNRRTKVIVSERFVFPDGSVPPGVWCRYQFYRFANAITVNSYHQKDRILGAFPWSKSKLFAIWNGVDIDRFKPRSRVNLHDHPETRLLAVATVERWKNAYNLIKGLAKARADGANIKIDWAGRVLPTKSSQDEYERCRRLVNELGLDQEWRWLGVCKKMHDVYPVYDALVHPSYEEGLPNAICEALATGLPVLASGVCDHPLLIQDGLNGMLFEPGNPLSIAGILVNFSRQSSAERHEMSGNARRFAETELAMDTMIEKYLNLACEESV